MYVDIPRSFFSLSLSIVSNTQMYRWVNKTDSSFTCIIAIGLVCTVAGTHVRKYTEHNGSIFFIFIVYVTCFGVCNCKHPLLVDCWKMSYQQCWALHGNILGEAIGFLCLRLAVDAVWWMHIMPPGEPNGIFHICVCLVCCVHYR